MSTTRNQYQNAVSANYYFVVLTSDPTYLIVQADRWIHADPSSNPITLTLPATPAIGELHYINDSTGFAGTNAITVNGNGNTINGSGTLTISTNRQSVILEFNGTAWQTFGVGGGSTVSANALGDNADARRMGPERNFIQGFQVNNFPTLLTTNLIDGGTSYSGADLVLSERRLLMTGSITYGAVSTTLPGPLGSFAPGPLAPPGGYASITVVSTAGFVRGMTITISQTTPPRSGTFLIEDVTSPTTMNLYTLSSSGPGSFTFDGGTTISYAGGTLDGQLVSMETGGYAYGLDFSFPALQTLFTNTNLNNPTALIGVSVASNFFNSVAVTQGGVISNYIYESIHSTGSDFNITWDAGPETWAGARACYVYQDRGFDFGGVAEIYWTAPLEDKVYQGNIFFDTGDPTFQTFTGQAPTGICAVGDNTFWVSFASSGVLRHYQVVPQGPVPHNIGVPSFAQVGGDIPLTNVVELLFDGKYLWAASTNGSFGTIYKLDQLGVLLDTYAVYGISSGGVSTKTRMCFDGISVWITLGVAGTMRIFTEGGTSSISDLFLLNPGAGNEARGICAHRDGTVYIAIYNSTNLTIQAFFPTTGSYPDVRREKIVWTLGQFEMPTTFQAIVAFPLSTHDGSMRLFDLDIVATSEGFGGWAAWKKSIAVLDNGTTMTLQGSVADVIPPRLNSLANTQGWTVTATDGPSLAVTISSGTGTNPTIWTINLTETFSYGGAL